MEASKHPQPTVFIIFGAGGDLTRRKLVPALYNLSSTVISRSILDPRGRPEGAER